MFGSLRHRIMSFRLFTPNTGISFTRFPSRIFSSGITQKRRPSSLARITRGKTPATPWIPPFRLISPTIITPSRRSGSRIPAAASTAAATGRSKPAPSFFISAGAKFTVTFFGGRQSRLFLNAVRTLSWASLTWAEGNPTIAKEGRPSLTSASTWISRTSIP